MGSPTDRDLPGEVERGADRGWTATVDGDTLILESSALVGDLATSPACRATAVGVLADRDVETIVLRRGALEYRYDDHGVALLRAAGRFVDLLDGRHERLATLAARDPLEAAREATARGGSLAALAAEAGLALVAAAVDDYDEVLEATVGFVDANGAGRRQH